MSHYDDMLEEGYEERRLRRHAEIAPLIAQGKEWLAALRRTRVGERPCDKVEEALFWLSKQL